MADSDHIDILLQGLDAWNNWRMQNPQIKPDISKIDSSNFFTLWALKSIRMTSRRLNFSEVNMSEVRFAAVDGLIFDFTHANLSKADLTQANLRWADLINADLTRAQIRNADLFSAKLINANLIDANLSHAILIDAALDNANLRFANLNNSDFSFASLCGADLSGANLIGANFKRANLQGSIINEETRIEAKWNQIWKISNQRARGLNLTYADLIGANLQHTDLSGIQLNNAAMKGVNLRKANLSYADLSGADMGIDYETNPQHYRGVICTDLSEATLLNTKLHNANLGYANLKSAILNEADLSSANLNNVKLGSANLSNANLSCVNLSKANLCKAKLISCNLHKANLSDAKLSNSDMKNADLRGANLSNTKLSSVNLRKAYFDEETIFPQGFNPLDAGMINLSGDYENPNLIADLLADRKDKKYINPPPRPGQVEFRENLCKAYDNKCAISGCDIEKVLEAAHIIPWKGNHSHEVWNGLLLRSDIHKLVDAYLIAIHPETNKILIHPSLEESYPTLNNLDLKLRTPIDKSLAPKKDILKYHFNINMCREKGWIED